jgi:hypothetical protein
VGKSFLFKKWAIIEIDREENEKSTGKEDEEKRVGTEAQRKAVDWTQIHRVCVVLLIPLHSLCL